METKKIIAKPLIEVAGIKFGDTREMVRKVLGEAKEFKKSKFSKNTTDDFGFCHVFYNSDNTCEAIELFEDAIVYIGEQIIFPTSLEQAKKIIGDFLKDGDGYTNVEKSIGIYAPNEKMESILFGADGYYK